MPNWLVFSETNTNKIKTDTEYVRNENDDGKTSRIAHQFDHGNLINIDYMVDYKG